MEMKTVFDRPAALTDVPLHYCPGCTHGIVHRLVAEAIDELGILDTTVGIAPVGCSVFAYNYFECDMIEAAHGRAPAVATGVKRTHPDTVVFTYQGDGDLAAIGTAETVHAATRGENITVIFINNCIYGMTGGQMAPTTLIGQKTTTTVYGRDPATTGYPMKMCELISQLEAPRFVARYALNSPKGVREAKAGIKKAFEMQLAGEGFTFIELLTNCPTNWKMSPLDTLEYMNTNTIPYFKPGVYKDVTAKEAE
jgi:2-oxoglutarate ferredoxin oxidoreductase subunit beta